MFRDKVPFQIRLQHSLMIQRLCSCLRRLGKEDIQTETPVKHKEMLDIQRRYDMANEM